MLVWKVMFTVSTLQLGSDPPHFAAKINSAAVAGQETEEKTAK